MNLNFSQPPPTMVGPTPNLSAPPPNVNFSMPPPQPPGIPRFGGMQGSFGGGNKGNNSYFRHHFSSNYMRGAAVLPDDFDGKRLRKSVMRKTVDYNASIVRALEVNLLKCYHRM